jgi:hypothetical protein
MRRKQILVAVIVLVVFCLGVFVGRRARRSPSMTSSFGSRSSREMAGCVDFHGAGAHAGETGCVSGRVLRVFTSQGGTTFLDFCEDYRECPFTSVIFSSDKRKFGDLQSLAGRQIEIRGFIDVYKGRPEIVIRDPEQIRLAP